MEEDDLVVYVDVVSPHVLVGRDGYDDAFSDNGHAGVVINGQELPAGEASGVPAKPSELPGPVDRQRLDVIGRGIDEQGHGLVGAA